MKESMIGRSGADAAAVRMACAAGEGGAAYVRMPTGARRGDAANRADGVGKTAPAMDAEDGAERRAIRAERLLKSRPLFLRRLRYWNARADYFVHASLFDPVPRTCGYYVDRVLACHARARRYVALVRLVDRALSGLSERRRTMLAEPPHRRGAMPVRRKQALLAFADAADKLLRRGAVLRALH